MVPIRDLDGRIERARRAASAAGRPPDALRISALGQAIVGPDDATYRRRLEAEASYRRTDPVELERSFRECRLPHGTPGRAAEQMARLEEAGVTRFYLQAVGQWDEALMAESLEIIGA